MNIVLIFRDSKLVRHLTFDDVSAADEFCEKYLFVNPSDQVFISEDVYEDIDDPIEVSL